ncbi:MAG: ParB/RepB/Spo0J family partition protein [Gemmatimonadetes bacterium]|nr:ParB/RepB/Spo0J family partition protein [Gemmatimonadota bacterium]
MRRRGGLGTGLLGQGHGSNVRDVLDRLVVSPEAGEMLREIPVNRIDPSPFQTRVDFDDAKLDELAASIRASGIIQPIAVRERTGGRYELLGGERRWRAARRAGLGTVPARVRNVDDLAAAIIVAVENAQREQQTALEEAHAVDKVRAALRQAGQPAGVRDIGKVMGWSAGKVSERLTIADAVTPAFLEEAGLDIHAVNALPKATLLRAAQVADPERRAHLLRREIARLNGQAPDTPPPAPRWKRAFGLVRRGDTTVFRLRRRPEDLDVSDAREALAKLQPIVDALRARAGLDGRGA